MIQGIAAIDSEVRDKNSVRDYGSEFKKLEHRRDSDPMKLYPHVLEKLDDYFSIRGLTHLSGQRKLLAKAAETILQAVSGTVTAIPFQPGLGKTTLIYDLLRIFSHEFLKNTPIAKEIGGVIVVVEKTSEAEELEQLCNKYSPGWNIAKSISAPNDYNLSQGRCPNGTATSYKECPLVQSASQTRNTPILIMLHARYQRYMEDMTPFLTWEDKEGQHNRTLLMVDELPPIIEDNALSLEVLNKIESELAQFKPSYQMKFWKEKSTVLYEWNATMRNPYFQLSKTVHKYLGMYGLISKKELNESGFTPEKLRNFAALLEEYLGKKNHFSSRLINVLKDTESAYYAVGQDFTLFFPRIKKICGEGQPATFLFSGTASLSPELS